jgi:TonB family protein
MLILSIVLLSAALQGSNTHGPVRWEPAMGPLRPIKTSPPQHPDEARKAGLQGNVLLDCTIGADGRVTDAIVIRGDSPLSEAAVKAARNWRYEPLLLQGKATPFVASIQVSFTLEETLKFDALLESLSSKYEAVRESAATLLGSLFGGSSRAPTREARWSREKLTDLLKQEQSARVRSAAEKALLQLGPKQ